MTPTNDNHRTRTGSSSRRRHNHYTSASRRRLKKPSKFEILRICSYVVVLVWSLVALAIAAHFQSVLQSSDLTRFVPYALFTSVASILATFILFALIFVFNSNPSAIKVEIATLGLVGVFWLSLSVLTSISPAEDAEVECFADSEDTEPVAGAFTTDIFQSQYRVLVAAGCVNTFILLAFCALLSFLAFRHYNRTKYWITTTSKPLLDRKGSQDQEKSRSSSRSTLPLTDLPARVARKNTATKEKVKGIPLPAVTKGSGREPLHYEQATKEPKAANGKQLPVPSRANDGRTQPRASQRRRAGDTSTSLQNPRRT